MSHRPFTWLAESSKKVFTSDSAPLLMLLAIATVIRLPLMPFQGYWHDLASYVTWGNELVTRGFSHLYAVRGANMAAPGANPRGGVVFTAINYAPGMPYLFGLVVLLYNATLAPVTHAPLTDLVGQNGIGPFIAKLVILVADLATTTLLYVEARKRHSQRFAWLAAASFAFSPAVLYDGVIWGQTDVLVMLPVLIAVFAILSGRFSLAGISFAVAVLLKAQSVIFIPLILLYLWRWTRREDVLRFAAAFVGVALLLLLPVMVPRFQLNDMLYNMHAMSYNDGFPISRDAFNFWWLTYLNARSMGSLLLGVKIGLIADALFGVVTLVNGINIWRHKHPAYLCFGLALQAFGLFMFMGGQLERYLIPFIPLTLVTLIVSERRSSDRLLTFYIAGTALCLLNMMATTGAYLAGVSPMIPYVTIQPLSDFVFRYFGQLSVAIAGYIVATFAYAMHMYLSRRFEPLTLAQPSSGQASAPDVAAVRASGHQQ